MPLHRMATGMCCGDVVCGRCMGLVGLRARFCQIRQLQLSLCILIVHVCICISCTRLVMHARIMWPHDASPTPLTNVVQGSPRNLLSDARGSWGWDPGRTGRAEEWHRVVENIARSSICYDYTSNQSGQSCVDNFCGTPHGNDWATPTT
jgi:hypothetical protein